VGGLAAKWDSRYEVREIDSRYTCGRCFDPISHLPICYISLPKERNEKSGETRKRDREKGEARDPAVSRGDYPKKMGCGGTARRKR